LRAIAGLVRLMGRANAASTEQRGSILFLIGCRDEMVPIDDLLAVANAAKRALPDQVKINTYENGWHLLFRDLQAQTVWRDVADWVTDSRPNSDDAPKKNGTVRSDKSAEGTVPLCSISGGRVSP